MDNANMYSLHQRLVNVRKELSQLGEDLDDAVGLALDDKYDGDGSIVYEIGEIRDDVEACYDKLQRIVGKLFDDVNARGGPVKLSPGGYIDK